MKIFQAIVLVSFLSSFNVNAVEPVDRLAIDLVKIYNKNFTGRQHISNGIWLDRVTVSFASEKESTVGNKVTFPGAKRKLLFFYTNEDQKFINLIKMDQSLGITKAMLTEQLRDNAISVLCDRHDKSGQLYDLLRDGYIIEERLSTPEGWHLVEYLYDLSDCH